MHHGQDNRDQKHQTRIEHVHGSLVLLDRLALIRKLGDPIRISDQHKAADGVQGPHALPPKALDPGATRDAGRFPVGAQVEDGGHDDEEDEDDELEDEAAEHDAHALGGGGGVARPLDGRAVHLHAEAGDVDEHVDLADPLGAHDRVVLGVERADHAPQRHVDGRGEEGRRRQDQHQLQQERPDAALVVVREDAPVVAECFACVDAVVSFWGGLDREGFVGKGGKKEGSGWDLTYRRSPELRE